MRSPCFAIGGVIIAQSALQTGALGAAVGATEAMAPVSAAILGLVLLGEEVAATSATQIILVACGLAAVLWGIASLAHAGERIAADVTSHAVPSATPTIGLRDDEPAPAPDQPIIRNA